MEDGRIPLSYCYYEVHFGRSAFNGRTRLNAFISRFVFSYSKTFRFSKTLNFVGKRFSKRYYPFISILRQICCIFLILKIFGFYKTPKFGRKGVFRKYYYFIGILRQMCQKMMRKIFRIQEIKIARF